MSAAYLSVSRRRCDNTPPPPRKLAFETQPANDLVSIITYIYTHTPLCSLLPVQFTLDRRLEKETTTVHGCLVLYETNKNIKTPSRCITRIHAVVCVRCDSTLYASVSRVLFVLRTFALLSVHVSRLQILVRVLHTYMYFMYIPGSFPS